MGVFLYGSTEETLTKLCNRLLSRFPRLQIAGCESPPFRTLSRSERHAAIARINGSGAAFVFIGTGSPKQENWVWETRQEISAIQLCVGAAFDFIAETKPRAPKWMQRCGLEWLHRVCSEPKRLGKRYALGNARFAALLVTEILGLSATTRL
jgi:N-acetylglucosaminyldiphosphoundecaprenol N-acetyl-beta-D-mannosaminyltransferase